MPRNRALGLEFLPKYREGGLDWGEAMDEKLITDGNEAIT